MSVRDFPAPRGANFGKPMWCKWCDGPIPKVIDGKSSTQRMWHPHCVYQYELHTKLSTQFDYLVDVYGKRCRCCPDGAPIPKRWINRGEVIHYQARPSFGRIEEIGIEEWSRRSAAWSAANPNPVSCEVDLIDWIEVDHRVPLWEVADLPADERRWYFGPGNLWLLCGPHHQQKTAREAKRRAWIRRLEKAQLCLDL